MKRKISLTSLALTALTIFMVMTVQASAGEVVIVTNKGVPQGAVNAEAIKKIYSGYMFKWPDNQTIALAVMEKTEAHGDFLKSYVGKTESQFSTTWKKMVFSGQASYPKQFDSAQSLVDYVKKTPGAIGYVEKGANTDGVNVVK
jgi:ABC-type phosphate transport system substrate-binding protein